MNLNELLSQFVTHSVPYLDRDMRATFERAGLAFPGWAAGIFKCYFRVAEHSGPRLWARATLVVSGERWSVLADLLVPIKGRITRKYLDQCEREIKARCELLA